MKILVTGSAGFIGSAVCSTLLQNGHTVLGIDNYSKYGVVSRGHDNHINYHFTFGDCKNTSLVLELINQADLVIHTAASIGGIKYWNDYGFTMLIENERITTALFEAWYGSLTKPKMIIFSSSQVYENCLDFPNVETQIIIGPTSGYGLQKLLLEKYAIEAHKQAKLTYTIVRPFNAYGLDELTVKNKNHVIVDLINAIKKQSTIELLGDGNQIRTFTYINDIADAINMCVSNPESDDKIYNVCSDDTVTINELVELIAQILNKKINVKYVDHLPNDVRYRKGSSALIQRELGWKPHTNLEKGLRYIIYNHDQLTT